VTEIVRVSLVLDVGVRDLAIVAVVTEVADIVAGADIVA